MGEGMMQKFLYLWVALAVSMLEGGDQRISRSAQRRNERGVELAMRYQGYPDLCYARTFGTPFYARYFAWPYTAPYDYGFYFSW